jgi:hypothetical protein
MTFNYALGNLLCGFTGLTTAVRRMSIKNLNHISLAANQVLLPAYGFIYVDKIKKNFIFLFFVLVFLFLFWFF